MKESCKINPTLFKVIDGGKVYDRDAVLNHIVEVGKTYHNPDFNLKGKDIETVLRLCIYFFEIIPEYKKYNIEMGKGVLLIGPTGCGKTTIIQIFSRILGGNSLTIPIHPSTSISNDYSKDGPKAIEKYSGITKKIYCIDDLGIEKPSMYYGNKKCVISEIIHCRSKNKAITYATSDLSLEEIRDRYEPRIISRMREMFNVINYDISSLDKRK